MTDYSNISNVNNRIFPKCLVTIVVDCAHLTTNKTISSKDVIQDDRTFSRSHNFAVT